MSPAPAGRRPPATGYRPVSFANVPVKLDNPELWPRGQGGWALFLNPAVKPAGVEGFGQAPPAYPRLSKRAYPAAAQLPANPRTDELSAAAFLARAQREYGR